MKKIILFFLASAFANSINAQDIKLENDTLYYGEHKFYEGQVLKLGYGSGDRKEFDFIKIVSGSLPAKWSKTEIEVTAIKKVQGKFQVVAISKANRLMGKLRIDIEGAVDNKELIL